MEPTSGLEPLTFGWDGHRIFQCEFNLQDTHAEHLTPGLSDSIAFREQAGVIYWLSITAENGHAFDAASWEFLPNDDPVLPAHFWGWHTSPDSFNDTATMGTLGMRAGTTNWAYGDWAPIQPQHGQFDMAFELLTRPVPEPAGLGLWAFGLGVLGLLLRRE
ncbi:MAG: hypothetical protein JRG85_15625 [Deltaproteobacteria bacterium]|nr:hypothetical protein [Deltaproteobacteria bacterium]